MGLIAFDCDGPLADFVAGLCSGLASRGFDRKPEEIRHWDLRASLTPEENAHAHEVISTPGFCTELPWVAGTKNLISYFRGQGHDVTCVTSPWNSPTWMHERATWLSPVFPKSDVLFVDSKRKPLVRADLLIEDHPGTAASWLEAHPTKWAILVDRPWNRKGAREYVAHPRMVRAATNAELVYLALGVLS